MNGRYLTLSISPKGNLCIELTPEGREYIEDHPDEIDYLAFDSMIDDIRGNGHIDTMTADEIGAITDCKIIVGTEVQRDDEGKILSVGRCWWHENYAVESLTEELVKHGKVYLPDAGPVFPERK